jgi:hypothetical protein
MALRIRKRHCQFSSGGIRLQNFDPEVRIKEFGSPRIRKI